MISAYLFSLINNIYMKHMFLSSLKYASIVLFLNLFCYYNFFINIKDSMMLNFDTLSDFTNLHFLGLKSEMELNYLVLSYKLNMRVLLKVLSKKENLMMSLNNIFLNSAWLESEVWDMFGMKFMFHTDLSSMLTDYGFLGHPLLKYFPLSGFYELSFDEIFNKMIKELMELAQAYRVYNYMNPWSEWYS